MKFRGDFLATMEPAMQKAFAAMDALEAGAIANPDEKRMVGHYWLRDPTRAPTPELRARDRRHARAHQEVRRRRARRRVARPERALLQALLVIGIGGSALGPSSSPRRSATPAIA